MEQFGENALTGIAAVIILTLGFLGAPLWLWTLAVAGFLAASGLYLLLPPAVWIGFAAIALIFNIPLLRRYVISLGVFKFIKAMNFLPQISETEQVALKAGDVWVEREYFDGKPHFKRLMTERYPQLTPEEKAFIDGPVEELCRICDDWDIWKRRDLPKEAWDFIKKERFWGMGIPKEYGGLAFSALAHSEVLMKLASRSVPLCVTVMVPNSLGPAELLGHYGTKAQKDYFLPRLARGEEIPCFGLTEPHAGSDAASIQSTGVVFKGSDGKLQIRLNWNKRWITLSSVSTVLGIAFRLKDPENHLGRGEDLGITCALIPTSTAGVVVSRRHDPLGVPFYNSPTQGKDVVVPIENIIGGVERAGDGWRMLMESLGAGRGISLPAQSTGGAKLITRVTSAHATVRRQFGMSIGRFEGIGEPLARIGGYTYLMEAARKYTLGALDSGSKPPVITAIAKYNFTELARKIVNDGMDIMGGAGITMGPRNLLAQNYIATPISITVEGANILTRTLMIFGQGALRAHPYAYREIDAMASGNLAQFDLAFWGHIGHIVRNTFRSVLLTLSRGYLVLPPGNSGSLTRYYQKLSWCSAIFALMTDISMGSLGGKLKAKGKITGRFADILSWMYLGTSVLRRYEAEGRQKEDLPFVHWSMQQAFTQIQSAFDGIFSSVEIPLLGALFRGPIRWLWAFNPIGRPPSDKLDLKIAAAMQRPGALRDRLTAGIYTPKDPQQSLGRLEKAFRLTVESEDVFAKVRRAVKKKKLKKQPAAQLYEAAVQAGIITRQEFESIAEAEAARNDAIQVDDFSFPEYFGENGKPGVAPAQPQTVAQSQTQLA